MVDHKGEMENLGPVDRQLTHTGKMKIFKAIKEYIDAKIESKSLNKYVTDADPEKAERLQKADTSLKDIILHLRWTVDDTEAVRRQ